MTLTDVGERAESALAHRPLDRLGPQRPAQEAVRSAPSGADPLAAGVILGEAFGGGLIRQRYADPDGHRRGTVISALPTFDDPGSVWPLDDFGVVGNAHAGLLLLLQLFPLAIRHVIGGMYQPTRDQRPVVCEGSLHLQRQRSAPRCRHCAGARGLDSRGTKGQPCATAVSGARPARTRHLHREGGGAGWR
jgi:hypothetical protein